MRRVEQGAPRPAPNLLKKPRWGASNLKLSSLQPRRFPPALASKTASMDDPSPGSPTVRGDTNELMGLPSEGLPHHERQTRLFCAVHATNAVLQAAPFFTAAEFDSIAAQVELREASAGMPRPLFSAHRVPIFGAWSVEVIRAALHTRSCVAEYFPSAAAGDAAGALGFLVNRPSSGLSGLLGGRHWVALAPSPRDGQWHDFDSNLAAPRVVGAGHLADVLQLLSLEGKATQALLVRRN